MASTREVRPPLLTARRILRRDRTGSSSPIVVETDQGLFGNPILPCRLDDTQVAGVKVEPASQPRDTGLAGIHIGAQLESAFTPAATPDPTDPALSTTLRPAQPSDIPVLRTLIERSARALSVGFYSPRETEAAIRYVFGVDSTLIADGSYFVVAGADGIVGCGGWSRRRTLYGGDQRPVGTSDLLDPATDAARIRAFFVGPEHARQGIGRRLLGACRTAAEAAGFTRLELMATLPGVPFYAAHGFVEMERITDTLPDGTRIAFVRMGRAL
jgi:GNAT superfamily N-acetyltransferase